MIWFSCQDGTTTGACRSTRRVSHRIFTEPPCQRESGYSGVVIYTRNATCAPVKAEEGITGILTPPNSTTSFRDLPDEDQIGGYPNFEQLSQAELDPAALDSEGRCVILEFPAFVLIGTYCPAQRDETRTHYRTGFLRVLDSRIRNLVAMGKRVIWAGDLNISREVLDTAAAEESMKKDGLDTVEWMSIPARSLFNQLLVGGKVYGERDEGRETAVMWDVCRGFHPGRKGMYTCWETKVNARPGNYGSRIDYIVCSYDMKDWFSDSNIQEGLLGSDHCPVYAVLKDKVVVDGEEKNILDIVNPEGMFENGIRRREWSHKNLLPMSGKLIQEFDRRRNIRDMFTKKPTVPKTKSPLGPSGHDGSATSPSGFPSAATFSGGELQDVHSGAMTVSTSSASSKAINGKRTANTETSMPSTKRNKTASLSVAPTGTKGQQSLKGFFTPKTTTVATTDHSIQSSSTSSIASNAVSETNNGLAESEPVSQAESEPSLEDEAASFATKQTWGKLFARPIAPRCEHGEPCKTMVTKKPGVNCGRSFWMCNRPLGPNGKQERGTHWRCPTFIWASDWDGHTGEPG